MLPARRAVRRGFTRALRTTRPIIAAAVGTRMGQSRTRTMTQTSKNGGGPLTNQRDFKVDYVRRRPNRRKLRRRRRWAARVTRQIHLSQHGRQQVLRQYVQQWTSAAGETEAHSLQLYGSDGTLSGPDECADLREFFRESNQAEWDNGVNPLVDTNSTTRLRFVSANMEITIRNVLTGDDANDVIVTAYHWRARRDLPGSASPDPRSAYELGLIKTGVIVDPDNPTNPWDQRLEVTDPGSTPFHSSFFCRHFVILKRTKYRIPPGDEINIMLKDNRMRTIPLHRAIQRTTLGGHTQGILFEYMGTPGLLGGVTPTLSTQSQLVVTAFRRYSFYLQPGRRSGNSLETTDP